MNQYDATILIMVCNNSLLLTHEHQNLHNQDILRRCPQKSNLINYPRKNCESFLRLDLAWRNPDML